MPILSYPQPEGSGLVWGCNFEDRLMVQSQGGIIVGSTVGNGISPTAATSRVLFRGTENCRINAAQMTIALRFRMGSSAMNKCLLGKWGSSNNQFLVYFNAAIAPLCYIAASASDLSNYFLPSFGLSLATEYHIAHVYDGSLAAGNRVKYYVNGTSSAGGIIGTIPTTMRASDNPISVFNFVAGTTDAPPTDFLLRSARIYNRAWSLAEVQDDFLQQTYARLS